MCQSNGGDGLINSSLQRPVIRASRAQWEGDHLTKPRVSDKVSFKRRFQGNLKAKKRKHLPNISIRLE